MSERMISVNGVDLCTESFGNPADPPILLMMGATASMLWWDDKLCRKLAEGGRFVIRYDNRDTGRSVTYEPGSIRYTLEDMEEDAVGVLDSYGIERAHLAGASLGAMIAQMIAVDHPGRVRTLTLIMSSPIGPERPDLPPMDERVPAYHASGATLDWSDENAAVDFMVGAWRLISGSRHPFDDVSIRRIATREFRRAISLRSMFNHGLLTGGEQYGGRLGEITAPTLVIHGTEDPVLPYEHGIALAREIPGAVLLPLQGGGHELHREDFDIITDAILRHTAGR